MNRWLTLGIIFFAATSVSLAEDKPQTMMYELRIYHAPEGKLAALNARFRDHTVKLFEKHGLTSIGYWTPIDNPGNKLYYIIGFPDKAARDASFKAFVADPAWQKAYKESEKDGKLTSKIESYFLSATDYSPMIQIGDSKKDRVFELRTYTATAGNLDGLNARFRDHTVKLFEKHGMTNFAYFNLAKDLKQKDDDKMLIYLLAHDSVEAAKKSFGAFREDAAWVAARKASEEKAGGTLTEPKGGVVSLFLKPTDYSPTK